MRCYFQGIRCSTKHTHTQSNCKLHKCVQPWWQYCRPESNSAGCPDYQGWAALEPEREREREQHSSMWPQDVQLARRQPEIQPMLSLMYFMHFHFMVSLWSSERHVCSMTWRDKNGSWKIERELRLRYTANTCFSYTLATFKQLQCRLKAVAAAPSRTWRAGERGRKGAPSALDPARKSRIRKQFVRSGSGKYLLFVIC